MPLVASHADIASVAWLLGHGVVILVILAAAAVAARLVAFGVRRVAGRVERRETLDEEGRQRLTTLSQVVSRTLRAAIWTVALLLVLDQVGVNLAPLIAGAGIAGLALGFGAQALVRDFLSGFFILLENQFHIGDNVEVSASGGTVTGVVEGFSMRVTQVRSLDGALHFIPNGNIQEIANRTQGWARAVVDVGVGYGEDLDRVQEALEELMGEIAEDAELGPLLVASPEVWGVESLADSSVVVRVVAQVRPPNQWAFQRELRKRIKRRFDERGIEIPFPQRVVWMRREGPGEGGDAG